MGAVLYSVNGGRRIRVGAASADKQPSSKPPTIIGVSHHTLRSPSLDAGADWTVFPQSVSGAGVVDRGRGAFGGEGAETISAAGSSRRRIFDPPRRSYTRDWLVRKGQTYVHLLPGTAIARKRVWTVDGGRLVGREQRRSPLRAARGGGSRVGSGLTDDFILLV
jgi:hypothetical protein